MTTKDDAVDPGQASAPDLDVWRAEAGACAPLDAAATRGPWLTLEEAPRWDTPNAVGYDSREHHRGPPYYATGVRAETIEQAETDAAFIAAARTGWPRDAARVARLADMLARAQAILDALPHCLGTWVKGSGGHCVYANDCRKIATVYEDGADGYQFCDEHGARNILDKFREEYLWADEVRALAAGTAAAGAKEPSR